MRSSVQKTAFFLLWALTVSTASFAESDTLQKGILQYQRESYDEAMETLRQARGEDPASTRASYYLGLTHKRLQDYKGARTYLTEAVEGSPKIIEALPELIEVCYQIDDIPCAKRWIAVAEEQGLRPGQTSFIKGLVLAKAGETKDAVTAFQSARELEPALKQSADYQIGLAYLKDESWEEAAKNFQEVVLLDPNTEIGRFADEYKKALDRRRDADRPVRLNAGLFTEYDDNVVLRPSDDLTAAGVQERKDWREVLTMNVESGKKINPHFGLAAQYNLYHTIQNELHAFDISSHTLGVVPSVYVGDDVVSAPVQYNYTWVDTNSFLSTVSVNPVYNKKLAENLLGQVGIKHERKAMLAPTTPDEDRDAKHWVATVGGFYFFDQGRSFLNLRAEADTENTVGPNWDYDGYRLSASVLRPLNERWKMSMAVDGYWQKYTQTHTVYLLQREDRNITLSAMLSYAIAPSWDWQIRYTYTDHPSNITVYDYERNVISTGVTARF
jgi:tetratricopeptide (TPR) repeat protein